MYFSFHRGDDDAYRVERVLATARVVIAGVFAVLLQVGTLSAPSATGLLTVCSTAYLLYSAILFVALRPAKIVPSRGRAILHLGDLVWATVCTSADGGAASTFFALHLFAVLAASYRWGRSETLATAAASMILVTLDSRLLPAVPPEAMVAFADDGQLALYRQVAYLFVTAYLGGYLADEDRRLRERMAARARLVASAKSERGFFASLQAVATEMRHTFRAGEFLLAVDNADSGRAFLISSVVTEAVPPAGLRTLELTPERRANYLFTAPPAWAGATDWGRNPDARPPRVVAALDLDGQRVETAATLPESFVSDHPCQSFMSISLPFGDGSRATLFLLDVSRDLAREEPLRFLQQLAGELAPIVHGIYLYRRLRRRAGAIERARIARELHDWVIQSLIGVEMSLEALRLRLGSPPNEAIERELARVERSVHDEVLNLRDLMQQLKPRDLGPTQLVEHLIDMVDRFRRDSGIHATFACEIEEVQLPQSARRELSRILQEALINVRKHSGARHVRVHLQRRDSDYSLVVDDDGRGFDFEGRLGQDELDTVRRGPLVIKERVRAIGGELTVESAVGRGSRLQIVVPHRPPSAEQV